ncbi:MAG: hypothetical protein CM15mP46_1400 [Alphaproteobacteria bacterium]|nr:MAG: hypothetical protein CM15mP46_1400 [Alphaproteobacteria bacterium]
MADSQVPEKTVTLTDNSTGKSVPAGECRHVGRTLLIFETLCRNGILPIRIWHGHACPASLILRVKRHFCIGIAFEDLAEKSDFLGLPFCYLMAIYHSRKKATFDTAIPRHTMVHKQLSTFYGASAGRPPNGHFMRCDRCAIGLLS